MVEAGRYLWRSSGPTTLLKQGHLQLTVQDHVQITFECLQRGRLQNFPGQPLPVLSYPQSEKLFLDIQNTFCVSTCASGPVTGHHGEEPGSMLSVPTLQVFIYFDNFAHEPSLLQAEQLHLSQLCLNGAMLQSHKHLHGPQLVKPVCPVCTCVSWAGESRKGAGTPDVDPSGLDRGLQRAKDRLP